LFAITGALAVIASSFFLVLFFHLSLYRWILMLLAVPPFAVFTLFIGRALPSFPTLIVFNFFCGRVTVFCLVALSCLGFHYPWQLMCFVVPFEHLSAFIPFLCYPFTRLSLFPFWPNVFPPLHEPTIPLGPFFSPSHAYGCWYVSAR